MEGWVRLHRKLRQNPIYRNSKAVHCWVECLLRANHTEASFYLGRRKITLQPGQFITGRDEFAAAVSMSPSTAWFWLQQFRVDRMIDIKPTNKYSFISVKNWQRYQGVDSKVDSKRTANEQQKDTDNNVKKEKNDKNNNSEVVERICRWAYTRAAVRPSCVEDAFRRSVEDAIQRVGIEKVEKAFEYEENAIRFLTEIKNL